MRTRKYNPSRTSLKSSILAQEPRIVELLYTSCSLPSHSRLRQHMPLLWSWPLRFAIFPFSFRIGWGTSQGLSVKGALSQ